MGGKTFVVITSQLERARFAELHLGVRSDFGDSKHISLPDAPVQWQSVSLTARRNSRHFAPAPVSLDDLALLLAALRSNTRRGRWKYNYASAGGLYPVQAYLCIHQRLRALSGAEIDRGTYYYNPAEHALVLLEPEAALNGSMHSMINRPVFAEATFSLFLVAEMAAVAPMYGSESLRFALIEAGMMAQLLDQTAVLAGVGLCHIGTVGFDSYRDMFRLGPSHMLLHAYLGGRRVSEESCDYPQRYSNDIQRAWN